ncbi:MAG: radical SAM protein [Nitrospirae bacterium]|nr:radical SAM protein [Nitrospirota bacterium]
MAVKTLDYYETILDKAHERAIPLTVHWDVTNVCHLDCVHCYRVVMDRPELTTDQVYGVLEGLASAGTLFITFSGGEIFMRRDFIEIARRSRELGFALRLLTTATMVNGTLADEIASWKPLAVLVSIYGAHPDIHDSITLRKGSFEKSVRGIRLLNERGVRTYMNMPIMKQNQDQYHDVMALGEKIGAKLRSDLSIVPKDNGDRSPQSLRLMPPELACFIKETTPGFAEEFVLRDYQNDDPLCGAGSSSAYISPYGDLMPCVAMRVAIGNLRERSFGDLWGEEQLKQIRALRFGDLKTCRSCSVKDYCSRCTGVAHLETGDLKGPSPTCCEQAEVVYQAVQSKEGRTSAPLRAAGLTEGSGNRSECSCGQVTCDNSTAG